MTHARLLILFISTFSFFSLSAQVGSFDVEYAIESLFALPETDLNYQELYERYLLLYENPLDLNSATYSDLKTLHAFSEEEIEQVLSYRDSVKQINSIYELAYLENIDPNKIQKLAAFITISNLNNLKVQDLIPSILSHRNAYLIIRHERRLELSRGYQGSVPAFAGDPNKVYIRYRNALSKRYSLGLTAEKDAGEAFTFDKETYRNGMDFWSFHLMIENHKKVKKAIVGDYQLQFGQGLIFNTGLGIGKGAETINTSEKVFNGIRPYSSVIEGGFLRGVALTYALNRRIEATTFYSSLNQDATLRNEEDNFNVFSTFQINGLHRTSNELRRKKSVNEKIIGLNLNYQQKNLNQIGIVWQMSQFSRNMNRGNDARSIFEFSGRQNMNLSAYINRQINKFRLFGEVGLSSNKSLGGIFGVKGKLDPRLQAVLLFRKYGKSFHSLRGGAFGEGSRNINEAGIYLGLKYTLNRQLNLAAYYDRFASKWLSFRAFKPAKGFDYLIRLNYTPNQQSQLYFQYRFKQKDRNVQTENQFRVLPGSSRRFILHLALQSSTMLNFRSKAQWSSYQINGLRTRGIAFFQDINLDLKSFRFSTRFSIFQTEGGDNRQFAYERDVLYAFSIPGLSGKGIRNYLLIQYSPSRRIDFWFKISRTNFFDRTKIGTGVETIDNNKLTDFRFQTMIRF